MSVIDTSVYVASLNIDEDKHEICLQWLNQMEQDRIRLYAPNIILAEVSAAISRGRNDAKGAQSAIGHLE